MPFKVILDEYKVWDIGKQHLSFLCCSLYNDVDYFSTNTRVNSSHKDEGPCSKTANIKTHFKVRTGQTQGVSVAVGVCEPQMCCYTVTLCGTLEVRRSHYKQTY